MKTLLSRDMLVPFLTEIGKKLEVVAPVLTNGERVFCTWTGQPLALDENPLNPPAEFLLPQRETLFRYVQESGRYTFEEERPMSRLIFGIRPCDLRAVSVLDRLFGADPRDHHYLSRRRSTLMAAMNCHKTPEKAADVPSSDQDRRSRTNTTCSSRRLEQDTWSRPVRPRAF